MSEIELTGFGGRPIRVNTGLFINNDFHPAAGGATLQVENPSTGDNLATVSAAQKEDPRGPRGLADLVERDADDLASLEALEAGVLFKESKALHVTQAAETLRYFAGWADKITGQLLSTPQGPAYTRREPLGVCAAVVPWNAPLMITIWKLGPAIAAGNVLIIKTPELTPLYAQKLASLIREAGFPPGVLSVLCGYGAVAGQALAEHPLVKKIAFTGSGPVGRRILAAAAATNLKKVTLELGGKGPSIVFADADLDNALFWTALGFTANNGQVCAAGSRIYVHARIYDKFLAAMAERLAGAAQGDPLDEKTTKGPVVSRQQRDKIAAYIRHAKDSGVRVLTETGGESDKGHFVATTAFAEVPDDARIMREEIFGPVASIASFKTEAEVIEKANATEYGLAAAVFTNDVSRAARVSEAIEAGQVTVNCWGTLHANAPFGGVKESGFGRDMGEEALDSWLTTKTVKYFTLPAADEDK
ncbi:Aldehyde dehydrogenase domain protein [Cordyceps fumosorosea ARSEF 2679]|uniref:aldehyde dehydrogenase (NAD(+)) n=1 Tax=Cordyceps fumosorosea (strain ARSEF 2679) TaxID=1081104 RepID=A0A167PPC0_CORFA|nr:Aldehyde dehydrogenase domain protein [Cordyceps fumosorosea ARSEF 2679]OAA56883.1 Aldehyde dehydrogenase domain protein [Cordyceps fumosorosea ARSEF 2679]